MKRVKLILLVCMTTILLCACKKDEAVTPDNAKILTYKYLYTLATDELVETKIYAYPESEFIRLVAYENLVFGIDRTSVTVSEDEVKEKIDSVIWEYVTSEKATEGKTKEGDTVNIDIIAYLDDKEIEGASLRDYTYTLGNGMLGELDEKLVNITIGEVFDMPAHFEEDYERPEVAGKDVLFTIKINYAIRYTLPERNEAFFAKLAADKNEVGLYTNLEEYSKYVKDKMYEEKLNQYDEEKKEYIWGQIYNNSELTQVPQWEYDSAYEQVITNMEKLYQENKWGYDSYDDFLSEYGYDEESIKAFAAQSASNYVKTKLVVIELARKEGVKISKEEYGACVDKYVKECKFENKEDLYTAFGEDRDIFVLERYYELLYDKVIDQLYRRLIDDNQIY